VQEEALGGVLTQQPDSGAGRPADCPTAAALALAAR